MDRLGKQIDRIDVSKKKIDEKWRNYQKHREAKGLFCCRKKDANTRDQCMRVFSSLSNREKHEHSNNCSFPPKDLVTHMHLLHLEGNIAFCLATGSMTNRCDATAKKGVEVRDGNEAMKPEDWFEGGCYNTVRRMNKRATKALSADLEYLFLAGLQRENMEKSGANKYTAVEALAYLLNLKKPDGRRKYSFDVENENGSPPSIKYLKNWFSRRARTYKEEKEGRKKIAKESNDHVTMTKVQLKSLIRSRFGVKKITRKILLMLLLDVSNELDEIPGYGEMRKKSNVNNLEEQCKKLKLPFTDEVETYLKLLELKNREEKMKNTESEDSSNETIDETTMSYYNENDNN